MSQAHLDTNSILKNPNFQLFAIRSLLVRYSEVRMSLSWRIWNSQMLWKKSDVVYEISEYLLNETLNEIIITLIPISISIYSLKCLTFNYSSPHFFVVFSSKWQKFTVKNTKYPMKLSQFCEIIPNSTSGWCAIEIRALQLPHRLRASWQQTVYHLNVIRIERVPICCWKNGVKRMVKVHIRG
jgi:hypothetical protein